MKNNRKGFTTVELVIVIAVIAILAAVLIPTFSNLVTKANESKALQEANNAYKNYMIENAEDLTGTTNLYIAAGGKNFRVENGVLKSEPFAGTVPANAIYIKYTSTGVGYECARDHSKLTTGEECTCGYKKTA